MVWAKLDDRLHHNPKVAALSDQAFRLWVYGLTWCSSNLTDGRIPEAALPLVWGTATAAKRRRAAAELVDRGLWHHTSDGWEIHDYLDFNPSADEVDSTSSVRSKVGSYGNHVRWHEQRGDADPRCPWCHPPHPRKRDRKRDRSSESPGPARPDPREERVQGGSVENGYRAVPEPADFAQICRQIAEERADLRIADGYPVRNRRAFVAKLSRSEEVRAEAHRRMGPPPNNVRSLLDGIGKTMEA